MISANPDSIKILLSTWGVYYSQERNKIILVKSVNFGHGDFHSSSFGPLFYIGKFENE